MPNDVYTMALEFRARLLAGEQSAARELVRLYRLAVARVESRVALLTSQIEAAGADARPSWIHERGRLATLRIEIEREINRFSSVASMRVAREARAAIEQARGDAPALVGAGDGSPVAVRLGTLNTGAVEAAAGLTSDASGLRALFATQGARVAQGVADEIAAGVAEGAPVRVVASRVRGVLGGELTRSLTISRTETLRAYRAAALDSYRATGIVTRYEWLAALDARTCVVCLALDGSTFATSQPMPAHVNCRCSIVPVIDGAPRAPRVTGREFFARLSTGAQRDSLGPRAFELYNSGEIGLSDLVGYKLSPKWGLTTYRRPLTEILTKGN